MKEIKKTSNLFLIIIFQFFYLSFILGQEKNRLDQKYKEYLSILEENSNLKLDTVELIAKLLNLRKENQSFLHQLNLDSSQFRKLKTSKDSLQSMSKLFSDSINKINLQNDQLKKVLKSDSLILTDDEILKNKMTYLRSQIDSLNQVKYNKNTELKLKVEQLNQITKYQIDIQDIDNKMISLEKKNKDKQREIFKIDEEIASYKVKLISIEDERALFTYFSKQKLESIKSRRTLLLSKLNCFSISNPEIDSYLSELNDLISKGISDSEINDIQQTIVNFESSCELLTEIKKVLQQKYDEQLVDVTLNQINSQNSLLFEIIKNKDLLNNYCKKTNLALAYINEASKQHTKLRLEYIDVIINEFNDYPYLKNELQNYRNTRTHTVEPTICK